MAHLRSFIHQDYKIQLLVLHLARMTEKLAFMSTQDGCDYEELKILCFDKYSTVSIKFGFNYLKHWTIAKMASLFVWFFRYFHIIIPLAPSLIHQNSQKNQFPSHNYVLDVEVNELETGNYGNSNIT